MIAFGMVCKKIFPRRVYMKLIFTYKKALFIIFCYFISLKCSNSYIKGELEKEHKYIVKNFNFHLLYTFANFIQLDGKELNYKLALKNCQGNICDYAKKHRLRCFDDNVYLAFSFTPAEPDKLKIIKRIYGEQIGIVSGVVNYSGNITCYAKNLPIQNIKFVEYWDDKIQKLIEDEIKLTQKKISLYDNSFKLGAETASPYFNYEYSEMNTFSNVFSLKDNPKLYSCSGSICKYLKKTSFYCATPFLSPELYLVERFKEDVINEKRIVKVIYGKVIDIASGELTTSNGYCKQKEIPIVSVEQIDYWDDKIKQAIEEERNK